MNRRRAASFPVLLLAVALLGVYPAAANDCDQSVFHQWRGYPVEMQAEGTTLAVADGAGLTIVDVSVPETPRILSSTVTPSESLALTTAGTDRLALLTREDLRLYDTSEATPRLLDSIAADGADVHRFNGDLIVVGTRLTIVDVMGDSLSHVRDVPLTAPAVASAVVGSDLFVAVPGSGTLRFDSSLAQSGRSGVVATAIEGGGGVIFLGRGSDGVFAVDYQSGHDRAVVLGHLAADVVANELLLIGDRLYASGGDGSLRVIDVTDPDQMFIVEAFDADLDVMATDEQHLYSYAFGSDRFGRRVEESSYLSVRDLKDEALPLVATLNNSTGPVSGVATDGITAWIADPPFLRAIDLSSGAELWNLRLDEPFADVRFENDRLLLFGRAWLHLVDPYAESGKLLGTWDTKGVADGGATFSGPWLIEANKASGFHVLDISDPSHIYQRAGLINDGRGKWLDVVGMPGVVYGMVTRGLKVVALSAGPSVEIVEFIQFDSITDVELITIDDRPYLLVFDGDNLHVHDLSAPLQPIEIAVVDVVHGKQLAVSDTRAWVLGHDGRVVGVDLSDPSAPQPIGIYEGMRAGLAIDASEDVLVGADLWALWATPLNPVGQYGTPALQVAGADDGSAELRWSSPPASRTELQMSGNQQFSEIDSSWMITGESISIEGRESSAWVRARFVQGCTVGGWSAPVELEPLDQGRRGRATRRP